MQVGSRMKKLLFYSHDSYGLGNIRRMVAIASFLVNRHRDLFILLLTGSPMYHAFRTHPQIDYVKLPCLSRDMSGEYQPRLKCFQPSQLKSLRAQLILSTFNEFKPDLCLIDKKPTGLSGELSPIFNACDTCNKCNLILLLRDILDSPTKTKQIWEKHQYHRTIEQHYDEVLVVGDESVFDLPKEYDFPSTVKSKTSFCGYLSKPVTDLIPSPFESTESSKQVVIAVGGGNDGEVLIDTYLNTLEIADFPEHLHHHIVLGPEMDDETADRLTSKANQHKHTTVERFNPDFISLISNADLVISMAGYNTVCELMSCNTPAILIPRSVPVEEQLIRAQKLSGKGKFEYLDKEEMTPNDLLRRMHLLLFDKRATYPTKEVNRRGMYVIEDKILSYLL